MDKKVIIQACCLALQIVIVVIQIVLNRKTEKRIDNITNRIKKLYGED